MSDTNTTITPPAKSSLHTFMVLEKPVHGSLNSPTSPHSPNSQGPRNDYPSPAADAAYHGLAGEIVRMIDPHTEADPVALLFQLLAAFGNIIGRDAYMVADGARHCLNLFGVLVGQSSKGRKGTSWNQIAALLERVDEVWRKCCVKSGLNSGEGLIWHVRDPITTTKPDGDSPGGHRQEVIDCGVADKRLFLAEGEFAGTLTVMERDANTLSAVIRSAWDNGNLVTLTKTSPAQSTGAHVSITGHITRDELLRLLNQTEAANGFANRFCWLAVKRSKLLPEGGKIGTVNFNPVIQRLKSAIDHARDAGEIIRSEATRTLWYEAYARLSEGKPGMLGSVTARGEAQVMRLSALYALLDESTIIEPAHHHAAMALWDYSARSARWIFGTATGDKKADRILEALRQAGEKGLTRTEITVDVFQRHITSKALGEALTIFERVRPCFATGVQTSGQGQNGATERWFGILLGAANLANVANLANLAKCLRKSFLSVNEKDRPLTCVQSKRGVAALAPQPLPESSSKTMSLPSWSLATRRNDCHHALLAGTNPVAVNYTTFRKSPPSKPTTTPINGALDASSFVV